MTERAKLCLDRLLRTALAVAAVVCLAATASAQETDGDNQSGAARIRWGPLRVAPTVSLTNVGTDSNVFNEADHPRSDVTATLEPSAQMWLRAGRAVVRDTTRTEAIGYNQYRDQSTLSTANTVRVTIGLDRVQPYAAFSYMHLRDRPIPEVDARVLRVERTLEGGLLLRISPRAVIQVSDQRTGVSFGVDGNPIASTLRQALNRSAELRGAGMSYELTPLTTISVDVQRETAEFAFSPERNAVGLRVLQGFSFKPTALISGTVRVGMLDYRPANPLVPRYSGVIAAADLRTVIAGDNLATAMVNRDLSYSVDNQLYYIQTSVSASLTRQLTSRWDIGATGSKMWLDYSANRQTAPSPADTPSPSPSLSPQFDMSPTSLFFVRPDTSIGFSAGIGYRLSQTTRVSFFAVYTHRDSELPSGRYRNLRTLGTVTYAMH